VHSVNETNVDVPAVYRGTCSLWMSGVVLLCVLSCVAKPAAAAPYHRTPVTTVKPLLVAAVRDGEAHGVLVGDTARAFEKYFRTVAPIEIDVRTMKANPDCLVPDPKKAAFCQDAIAATLAVPGCRRLLVTTSQRNVRIDQGPNKVPAPPQNQFLVYQISVCSDGQLLDVPSETIK
jgi:hypothetical protein